MSVLAHMVLVLYCLTSKWSGTSRRRMVKFVRKERAASSQVQNSATNSLVAAARPVAPATSKIGELKRLLPFQPQMIQELRIMKSCFFGSRAMSMFEGVC